MDTSEGAQQRSVEEPVNHDAHTEGNMDVEPAPKMASDVGDRVSGNVETRDKSMSENEVRMFDTAQGEMLYSDCMHQVINMLTVHFKSTAASPHISPLPVQQQGHLQASPFTSAVERPQSPTRQLPSPPPPHASVVSDQANRTQHCGSAPRSTFKLPTVPASAVGQSHDHRSVAPQSRNERAGTVKSRASSFTLPAQSRSEREMSVSSRTSVNSALTGLSHGRKRKEFNLNDDEEDVSDYAPSEPNSPSAARSAKGSKNIPAIKKTKILNEFMNKTKGKNGYGFKPAATPKPKPGTSSSSSSTSVKKRSTASSTVPSKPAAAPVTVVRASSTMPRKGIAVVRAKPATTSKHGPVLKKKFVPQPSRRRAAMHAENKIQGYFEDTKEFETECAIEDADQLEHARLPENFCRMSFTPVSGDESVEMLMERAPSPSPSSQYTYDSWTRDRAHGDRNMAKKAGATVEDKEDEEADISEYMSVNGVIVRRPEDEELDLTGSEQDTISGTRGGEGGWWGRVKGAMGCRMH